ncbi:heme ABC transporter ATP-binding protein/permease CydC [Thorsellia kenyensis]|uniref:Cysteine/glutathione ABC transporter ATP-binding protein/permease CydC n=1 Tax=Thorsellia kenyensis TaxID=1549888 RepID=A0ABV6C920_9GAMM
MFKALFPYIKLYKSYLGWVILGLLLAIITIFSGIGLLTLSGWFLASSAIAGIVVFTTFNYLLPAAFVRGLAISRTAFRYFERIVSHEATFRLLAKLRVSVFKMIFPRQHALSQSYRQADVLNRLISDVETLDNLYLRVITPFISAFVVICFMTLVLSFFNVSLALLLGAVLLLILIVFPPVFYYKSNPLGDEVVLLKSNYRDEFNRFLTGQTLYLIYAKWHHQANKLDNIDSKRMLIEKKLSLYQQLSSAGILILSGLTVCIMIYFSGIWINEQNVTELFKKVVLDSLSQEETYTNQVIFPAMAALFVFATLAAFEMLVPISHAFVHLGSVVSSANRLNEINNIQPIVKFDSKASVFEKKLTTLKNIISLESVSFTYPNQSYRVIYKASFDILPNQKVAITGHTGAGKSTLFHLLTRAYSQHEGVIKLFEEDIKQYNEKSLRESISVIPQTIYLFNDSLRDNLMLAYNQSYVNETSNELDDQLKSVLDKVGLSYLHHNEGLEQIMGDGGRQLSGGELRRIGIARALLHNAPVWLFDEPTEGLDPNTEEQIMSLIFHLSIDKTLLMITHKIKSLSKFDRVLSVENGQWTIN